MSLIEVFRVGIPAVVVPLLVFSANWTYRHRKGYDQTAAADFILAVLVFDGGVVAASEAMEPFVRNVDLRTIIVGYHMFTAAIACGVWWVIVTWAEPASAEYYETDGGAYLRIVPIALSWMAVFILVSLHMGFYFIRGTEVVHG
jgi:hypothetical protein